MEEEIIHILVQALKVSKEKINDKIGFGTSQKWDSLAHITLVSLIEDSFDIILEPEEINKMIDLQSTIKMVKEKTIKRQ